MNNLPFDIRRVAEQPSDGLLYWFQGGSLCFRIPENLEPIPAWIAAYVLDSDGNQLEVELSNSETDDEINIIEINSMKFPGPEIKWVKMTPLDGGRNLAVVVQL